jgi:hypothetical protein
MDPREQQLLSEIKEANTELQNARMAFAEAKRRLIDAESNVINAKLHVEKLTEELRVIRVREVIPDERYDLYDDES